VRAVLPTEPRSLCLIGKSDRRTEVIAFQITDSLVRYDSDLRFAPKLAESWERSEDGRTVLFHLRRDARWHDGRPVTADDVVFTVRKVLDPATEARTYLPEFEGLETVEAVDAHTVRAVYEVAYADYLEAWLVPIIPKHIAEKDEDILTGAYAQHPVGCGPFRFVRHVPGEEIVLEANPDYHGGSPKLDRLVFRIIGDERTSYQALLTDELDILAVTPDFWREAASDPRAADLERFVFRRLVAWYVAWNNAGNPFFGDPRVRRAMVHALDRGTFIDEVLGGAGVVAVTTYAPVSPWADPGLEPWSFDTDEASRLLAESGWSDTDGDGLLDRNGTAFRVALILPRGSQQLAERIAVWVQQSLAEIGVAMEIEVLEWGAYQEKRNSGAFHAAMSGLALTPEPDQTVLYHSSSRDDGLNFFGLDDPEVDRLLEAGRVTFDPEERREIYHRLQHRLHDLEPLSALFHFSTPVLHRPGLRGLEPSAIDFWRTEPGPRGWYWESAE
jgi:peptide/nickel transport system substrate-binding protein